MLRPFGFEGKCTRGLMRDYSGDIIMIQVERLSVVGYESGPMLATAKALRGAYAAFVG